MSRGGSDEAERHAGRSRVALFHADIDNRYRLCQARGWRAARAGLARAFMGISPAGIDKSVLAIPAPRRYRNREHLPYIAQRASSSSLLKNIED
jgi:hypothetical protein